jgi:hypothetical protein
MRVRHVRALALLLATTGAALGAASFAACAAVPELHFVADDARADVASDAPTGQDGGRDARGDGSCGDPAPAGGVCCPASSTWCVGQCDTANCAECRTKCATDEVCCGKPGNVLCKRSCQ